MKAKTETKKTTDAVAILDQMAGEGPELRRLTEEARINAAVAQLIYAARNKAGLSQAELARRIGTKQSVISRLEDADYEGHSLSMLHRIAAALGQCVEIRFLPPAKAGRGRGPNRAILEPVG
jgi:ribosome-binding protein aMBF1 (putative translation factor)